MTTDGIQSLAAQHGLHLSGIRTLTITEPSFPPGEYDAIVVDTNISWWSEEARSVLWQNLAEHLSPTGGAFVRFEAYPGAHMQELLRDIAHTHCTKMAEHTYQQVLAFLHFLAGEGLTPAYREFARVEKERLEAMGPAATLHELWGPRRVFRLAELEHIAHAHGLECLVPEPTMAVEQWAILHRQPAPAIGKRESAEANSDYHGVPYPEYVHYKTNPDNVSAIAFAFGLNPAPIRKCRVLELGCGTGLSLRAFAYVNPESEFLGVDFAKDAIESARKSTAELGLANLHFEAMDVMHFEPERGEFDYIIAHGLYGWVPDAIRNRILEICSRHLSERGIAFISFNANPGYRVNSMLRDAGLRAARHSTSLYERSKAGLEYLKAMPFGDVPPWRNAILQPRLKDLLDGSPVQAGFDEFGDINNAFRFAEFAAALQSHGLRYITESQIMDWTGQTFSPAGQQFMARLDKNPALRMSYRDLIRLATFHSCLVCKQSAQPSPVPLPGRLFQMLVSSNTRPLTAPVQVRTTEPEMFESIHGAQVRLTDPLIKAFFLVLYLERPGRLTIGDALLRAAILAEKTGHDPLEAAKAWLPNFWETGFIDLHLIPTRASVSPGVYPNAFPLARRYATQVMKLPTLGGSSAAVDDDEDQRLLMLLDGSRSLEELRAITGCSAADLEKRLDGLKQVGLLM